MVKDSRALIEKIKSKLLSIKLGFGSNLGFEIRAGMEFLQFLNINAQLSPAAKINMQRPQGTKYFQHQSPIL